ncbi:MAG: hypothetical protein ACTHQM_04080 [Thermoanaerobaculia bacterium]
MTIRFFLLATLAFSLALPLHAFDLHERVVAVYNFHPHELDDAGRDAKSKELDAFWNDVKREKAIDALRAELKRDDAPSFFAYDGAMLLLSMSQRTQDRALVAQSIARADLRDVQSDAYFYTARDLAMKGHDIVRAALHILDDESFQVIVPQHVLTLDRTSALFFLLLPLDESKWVPAAIESLDIAKNDEAQMTLIRLLAYAVDPRADAAVHAFAATESNASAPRKLASDFEQSIAQNKTAPSAKNVEKWRKQRRDAMKSVSDEAIYEVQRLTALMRGAEAQRE